LTLASGRYGLDNWISFIREGATLGAVYALLALGYTMVYGILRMINFATATSSPWAPSAVTSRPPPWPRSAYSIGSVLYLDRCRSC
jgi:hypothetical protein